MKRQKAIDILYKEFSEKLALNKTDVEYILNYIERTLEMVPPATLSKNVKPKDYRFGGGCTMRCNCEECNPDFLVHKWEE
jgi:hypothetical protein